MNLEQGDLAQHEHIGTSRTTLENKNHIILSVNNSEEK